MSPKKSSSKKPAAKRSASRKSTTKAVGTSPGEAVEPDARKKTAKASSKKAAKKPQPLTSKPADMTKDVLEFIQAIDDYKRTEGRPFPTWSEIFDVVKMLGYEKSA